MIIKFLTITIASLFAMNALSQSKTEGEIMYTMTLDMHASLEDQPNAEMMKQFIPQYQTSEKRLVFNSEATLFENIVAEQQVSEEDIMESDGSRVQVKIDMGGEEEKLFSDLKNNRIVETKELMGKPFLIKREASTSESWKITEEQKAILGMNCTKAVSTNDEMEVWFTSEIPVSSGPLGLGGLPGMILEATMDDGNLTLVATKNSFRKMKKSEIKPPKNGKEVTQEEFIKISQEKMQEMRDMHGTGEGENIMIFGGE